MGYPVVTAGLVTAPRGIGTRRHVHGMTDHTKMGRAYHRGWFEPDCSLSLANDSILDPDGRRTRRLVRSRSGFRQRSRVRAGSDRDFCHAPLEPS